MAKYKPKTKDELQELIKDNSINLGDIDVSKITEMSYLFKDLGRVDFSGIEKWNVSNVTDMSSMFSGCYSFNQPLEKWDVSNVTDMSFMFDNCYNFNQPLEKWDVSKVIVMESMFEHTINFNQPLAKWAIKGKKECKFNFMFNCAKSFNQDLSSWDLSKVNKDNIEYFLDGCEIDDKFYPKGIKKNLK